MAKLDDSRFHESAWTLQQAEAAMASEGWRVWDLALDGLHGWMPTCAMTDSKEVSESYMYY